MAFVNGLVYVTNDGTNNGATADSLVVFDPAGNWVATYPLTNTVSPFAVMAFQGDLLVSGSTATTTDDIHRYTTAGVSVGTFHDSATISFAHQISPALDGNVWCAGFSTLSGGTPGLHKIDAVTGAILVTIPQSGPRGVWELPNGNLLWTNSGGTSIYDVSTMTSTEIFDGGSYHVNPYVEAKACHRPYGAGCHDFFAQDNSNLFELFATIADGKAALDGNALQFSLTPNGYVANWLPGVAAGLYVPPSGGATIVADVSTGSETFTPSVAIPVPGGVVTQWTVSSEGILTAGPDGNEDGDSFPSLSDPASEAGLAFYTWFTQNPTESGSGKIKWEEVGGVLYVTFDGVECAAGSPTAAPSTYQFQINTTTGDVIMVWQSMSASNSTSDMMVGCTLAGTGVTAVSQTLSAVTPFVLEPDTVLTPMSLSASPDPTISPSTLVTYTANDVPEFVPGSGVYVGTLFLSGNPLPGGFDLAGILTTVPGCNAYIAALDLDLGGAVNLAPTLSWNFVYDNVLFAPGNVVAAQAVALFDPSFPLANGESGGFLLSNGLLTRVELQ